MTSPEWYESNEMTAPRSSSTPPSPADECRLCRNAGFVDSRPCPECSASATPSSPDTRDEPLDADTEAILDVYVQAALATRDADRDDSPALVDCGIKEIQARDALRAHIRALYNRQREEIAELTKYAASDPVEVRAILAHNASLSSQLEHQRRDTERVMDLAIEYQSQLERLKAEQLTPEEAQHVLDQIPDNQCGWPPKDCPVCDSLREKLRRLSDTGSQP